jgi:spermidine synthase
MKTLVLAADAFLTGAAIMIIEFIAVRFLQSDYGSSLDVWASEIAICMAGLAAGSALGGWLADRYLSVRLIGVLLVSAAITCLPMEFIANLIDTWLIERAYAWWHPLVAAGACSVIPLLLLGTVLPQIVRLQTQRLERLGRIAGGISAVSTLGGIVGVLLTTMLFSHIGVRETLWGIIVVLLCAGGGTFLIAPRLMRFAAVATAMLLVVSAPSASAQQLYEKVIFEKYSAYHHILVEERQGHRILWFDDAPQTTMSLASPAEGAFEYCDFFHMPLLLNPSMKRVLFVGLGGGSGPKQFLQDYPHITVDVAEIDPAVVDVSRQFFAVPEDPRLDVTVVDGRAFLRRTGKQYGAILMDAYASGRAGIYLPYHLATKEFFEIAWENLENGGCLVYNVVGEFGAQNNDTLRGVHATLTDVFRYVYVFGAKSSMNIVFVAQKIDVGALDASGKRDGKSWPDGPWLTHPLDGAGWQGLTTNLMQLGLIKREVLVRRAVQLLAARPDPKFILTDNHAPVDIAGGPGR